VWEISTRLGFSTVAFLGTRRMVPDATDKAAIANRDTPAQTTGAGRDVLPAPPAGRDEVEFTVDARTDEVWEALGRVTGVGSVALLSPERLTRVVHVDRWVGQEAEDLPGGRRQVVAVRVRGVVVGVLPPGS